MGDAARARYDVGQLIHHRLFDYRGVIIDVDPTYNGSEAWYRQMAHTQPPRDRPWYHVLVDGGTHQTYVAERNLEPDPDPGPINHPRVDEYFSGFDGTVYRPRKRRN